MKIFLSTFVILLFVTSCTTYYLAKFDVESKDVSISDVMDIISLTIQEYGYFAATVNENVGIITTEWKSGMVLISQGRTKLSITYNKDEKTVAIQPKN